MGEKLALEEPSSADPPRSRFWGLLFHFWVYLFTFGSLWGPVEPSNGIPFTVNHKPYTGSGIRYLRTTVWVPFGPLLGCFAVFWGPFGALLGLFGAFLAPFWARLCA